MIRKNGLYEKAYAAWAGNPKGFAPDYNRCCVAVWRDKLSKGSQCNRPRGYGPDEAYCKQHDPAAKEARNKKSEAVWNERYNKERYSIHGRNFFDALKKIADGHNDPRALAKEVIKEFMKGMKHG